MACRNVDISAADNGVGLLLQRIVGEADVQDRATRARDHRDGPIRRGRRRLELGQLAAHAIDVSESVVDTFDLGWNLSNRATSCSNSADTDSPQRVVSVIFRAHRGPSRRFDAGVTDSDPRPSPICV
jgi:hypothetical protein